MKRDEKYLCCEIKALNHAIRRLFSSKTNKREIDMLTGNNGWIIGYISECGGEVYQRDIEREFNITRSSVSKVISLMACKGFIKREPSETDARLKKLVLTPKSETIKAKMSEDLKDVEKILFKGFTEEEKAFLYDAIKRMKQNITEDTEIDFLNI